MSRNPLISVIIPCYNSGKYLPDSIESILKQTYQHIECIVVDDGSTDDTEQIVCGYVKTDERVRYFKKENGGPATARNFGIGKARGEYIQFLDSDDWLNTEKLIYQIKFIHDHNIQAEKFVLYSDFEIIWYGDKNHITNRRIHRFGDYKKNTLKKMIIGRKFGLDTPTPLSVCSTLFSKDVVSEFTFREDMVSYEDLEYFIRLLYSDTQFYYTPIIGFWYRQRDDSISKNTFASRIGYLQFLESIYGKAKEDLVYCPNMHIVLNHFFRHRDKKMFDRAISLLNNSNVPVNTPDGINIRNKIVSLSKLHIYYPYLLLKDYEGQISKRMKRIFGKKSITYAEQNNRYDRSLGA